MGRNSNIFNFTIKIPETDHALTTCIMLSATHKHVSLETPDHIVFQCYYNSPCSKDENLVMYANPLNYTSKHY